MIISFSKITHSASQWQPAPSAVDRKTQSVAPVAASMTVLLAWQRIRSDSGYGGDSVWEIAIVSTPTPAMSREEAKCKRKRILVCRSGKHSFTSSSQT